jgi:hypothetical protein
MWIPALVLLAGIIWLQRRRRPAETTPAGAPAHAGD